MPHDAHRSDTGREPLLSHTVPEEGDRVRVWYRSLWSDDDRLREVRGTATRGSSAGWYSFIEFDTREGVRYRLAKRENRAWELRRTTPNTGHTRRVSAHLDGVVAIATGQGPRLPPSPFAAWDAEESEESDAEPPLSAEAYTPDVEGQASLGDFQPRSDADDVEDGDAEESDDVEEPDRPPAEASGATCPTPAD